MGARSVRLSGGKCSARGSQAFWPEFTTRFSLVQLPFSMASVGYALPFGSFGYDTGSVFASSIGMTAAPPHFACLPLGAMPPFVFGAALPHQPQSKQQRRQQQDLVGQRAAPSRPARGRGRRAARVPITLQDVIQAVESLYADQLMPYGRLLRKRIVEQAAERSGGGSKEVEDRELRTLCTSCPRLQVEDVEAAEWTATLAGQPQDFVDVHSPEDLYPSQMWADAAKYLSALEGEEMVLPGGRYMCARTLVARGLAFLSGYSLGQVAHIVQLAISHKKLLGYSEGTLVPYARSQSMLKEKHAEIQRACPGAACRKGSVAGWEVLHECLRQILEEAIVVGQRAVPLSNLKRLFQERFGIELSETALGYAKLSELLQDARVQDLCEVQLASAGYVLLPLRKRVERSRISLVDGLGFAECGGACASVAMQQTPWSTDTRPRAISAQPAVAPTTTGDAAQSPSAWRSTPPRRRPPLAATPPCLRLRATRPARRQSP